MSGNREHTSRTLTLVESEQVDCWCEHIDDKHHVKWNPPRVGPDDPKGRFPRAEVWCLACMAEEIAAHKLAMEHSREMLVALAPTNPAAAATLRYGEVLRKLSSVPKDNTAERDAVVGEALQVAEEVRQIILLRQASDLPQA